MNQEEINAMLNGMFSGAQLGQVNVVTGDGVHISYNNYADERSVTMNNSGMGQTVPDTESKEIVTPRELTSNRGNGMLGELVKEKLLTTDWQPVEDVEEWKLAVIAHKVGTELNMANFWQQFAELWGRKPENMRSNYNRCLNTDNEIKFTKKLSRIF